ncbi:hypothetical protein IFM89_039138, partial [Coptis chinensis]
MALRICLCASRVMQTVISGILCPSSQFKWISMSGFSLVLKSNFLTLVNNSSASAMKNALLKLSYVYQCVGCDSFHLQSLARTVSNVYVNSMKDRYPAHDRISAVLTTVSEELPDVPLFLSLHNLCSTLKCTSPSAVMFRSAVINAGYSISGTHVNPLGLKSDAPMSVIWDIMRYWVKNHCVKDQAPDQSGSVILAKEPTLQANFARAVASLSKAQTKKMARFLPNPEKHWGLKRRAVLRLQVSMLLCWAGMEAIVNLKRWALRIDVQIHCEVKPSAPMQVE